MITRISAFHILISLIFITCSSEDSKSDLDKNNEQIIQPIITAWEFLPENLVAKNQQKTIKARYINPTAQYAHGILGDKIEAGGLLVTKNGIDYYVQLEDEFVFEDLRPRLKDVDGDGELEFITIKTNIKLGASVAIYTIVDKKLKLFAQSDFIGTPFRWLNIAAIDDLDNDGVVEIAWVQTPHIGGILHVGRIENNAIKIIDTKSGVSNHQIGSRNLCLSVIININGQKKIYFPNNGYDALVSFTLTKDKIVPGEIIPMTIDPSKPLTDQYDFKNTLVDINCINIL